MNKICIFAGTTEGRKLAEALAGQDVSLFVCAASEYGRSLLPESEKIRLKGERLDEAQIEELLQTEEFDLVIDATHPYARLATENIKAACNKTGIKYLRILREKSDAGESAVFVPGMREASEFLNKTRGNILLTTGSKELSEFTLIDDFKNRLYARVLPAEESLKACFKAGLLPSHVFAMQGPFSEEMNLALINAVDAGWLVSKDSGRAGGFIEKEAAVKRAGIKMLVIGRPIDESGLNTDEALEYLAERFGFVFEDSSETEQPCINIIGTGPGSAEYMSLKALKLLNDANLIIGSGRMLDFAAGQGISCRMTKAVNPDKILKLIKEARSTANICVLMSGDSGFYSGTKKLVPLLRGFKINIEPGISSLSYFAAKLGISYDDIACVSLHGRGLDIAGFVRTHEKCLALVGGEGGMKNLIAELNAAGLGAASLYIGERLSYPDEKIHKGSAAELFGRDFDSLSVVIIENKKAEKQ